jgi:hypothetical protein
VVQRFTDPNPLKGRKAGKALWGTMLEAGGLRGTFEPSPYSVWNLGKVRGEEIKMLPVLMTACPAPPSPSAWAVMVEWVCKTKSTKPPQRQRGCLDLTVSFWSPRADESP